MKIEIMKERRKTMLLRILDSENAVLKVPFKLTEMQINSFLDSKKNWLKKHSEKLQQSEAFAEKFDLKNDLYLNGEKVAAYKTLIPNFEKKSQASKKRAIKDLYFQVFGELQKLANDISNQTELKFKEVIPHSSVRVWGSFNVHGIMKLNWKLAILPKRLARYVICHELCHGLEMNHSSKFWLYVQKICPDFKKLKKELTLYSFVLKQSF